jgi:hypothetical protein
MATKRLPRPRDPIQLGKLIVDIATGQVEDRVDDPRNEQAVERGRIGGQKGVGLEQKFCPPPSESKSHERQLRLAGSSGSQPTKRSNRLPLDELRKKRHSKRILPVSIFVYQS